jgi:hypothetical protein
MVTTLTREGLKEAILTAKRIDAVSIRVDHERRQFVWTMTADGRDLTLDGGPEQLPGMLLAAQGLLSQQLAAPALLGYLGQN